MQKVTFKSKSGANIVGIISQPEAQKSELLVLIAHGFSLSKDGSAKQIADKLEEAGINSLRFDFFGHGESDGEFSNITISKGVEDILSAIEYAKNQGYSQLSLIGTSFGGACSILAASRTNLLSSLVLMSPVTDYYTRELMMRTKQHLVEWRENGYKIYTSGDGRELKLNYTFFEDLMALNGFKSAKNIDIPTYIVHGDQDESVPIILSEMLTKVIENCELNVIKVADHKYSEDNLKAQALGAIINFLQK